MPKDTDDCIRLYEDIPNRGRWTALPKYNGIYEQVDVYGFKAQPVGTIDELNHAVVGGQVGEDGMTSSRGLNYNAVFTRVAQVNRKGKPKSEGATGGANGRTTTTAQNHALTNSATRIS